MIIYNVTTKIHHSIHEAWLQWLKDEHVPEIIATGCFVSATIVRLLEVDEEEGPTYAVQYFADSKALYNLYVEKYAVIMRQRCTDKWQDRFIAFRSVMQVVN
ncbi:MAG: DUF4286 family protein [Ferruginibacter sp.]